MIASNFITPQNIIPARHNTLSCAKCYVMSGRITNMYIQEQIFMLEFIKRTARNLFRIVRNQVSNTLTVFTAEHYGPFYLNDGRIYY